MKTEYERNLHHAWMILEFDEIYEEDFEGYPGWYIC